MHVIRARNVNDAFPQALDLLRTEGLPPAETRCGRAIRLSQPVTTCYWRPAERVLYHEARDANPFFHLFEALWMLAGDDGVDFPATFNSRLREFSDDGRTLHGAYGRRWRRWFLDDLLGSDEPECLDQLAVVAENLRARPGDRRQVIGIWDPMVDLRQGAAGGKDVPCNVCCHVRRDDGGRLDLTVFCRSNDVVWGCYGSDVVTFSLLQEYLAARVGCPVGRYWQVSDDWHGYEATAGPLMPRIPYAATPGDDPYAEGRVRPCPLVTVPPDRWDEDARALVGADWVGHRYEDPFFVRVALPMYAAWRAFKDRSLGEPGRYREALAWLGDMSEENDWRVAAERWVQRRIALWETRR